MAFSSRSTAFAAMVLAGAHVFAQVGDDVVLEPIPEISGLSVPLGLKHAGDGSGRIFIVEQGGRVRVVDPVGIPLSVPFIDLGTRTTANGELGLLDIAFHPDYETNGRFFLHYSAGGDRPSGTALGDTILAEFSVSPDPNIARPAPVRTILTVAQDFVNHNGGQMKFGPDGYLYLALGDGGSAGDPCNRSRTLDPDDLLEPGDNPVGPDDCPSSAAADVASRALLGKILRLDIDSTTPAGENNLCGARGDGSAAYAVPDDNPFADDPTRCGEIWVYGLRNPWRFSFDRETGDVWIGDVGQAEWEEVNLLLAPLAGGDDLGWDCYEGASVYEAETDSTCPDPAGMRFPVLTYPRVGASGDCSVTGGYRYRGPVSGLRGRYVFGDYCSGDVRVADNASGSWQAAVIERFNTGFGLRSFGEDEIGHLYAIAGNSVYRFAGPEERIFADGFETLAR